ncbi:hypothetical protein [Stieleria sp.]|uniref:hypothetical protein n=1 Tax=Stieleria sp. TaxID=2795976 RepID=UPI00356A7E91
MDELMEPDPETLSKLFQLDSHGELWRRDEYAAIFHHQLQVSLADLTGAEDRADQPNESASISIEELLAAEHPPTHALVSLKQFAKLSGSRSDGVLPKPVSAVIYLLAIAKALQSTGTRITEMDDVSLKEKLTWAADQPWLDDRYRSPLRSVAEKLS